MQCATLGHGDISASRACLGTMTFGTQNSGAEAHQQLDFALSQGDSFIEPNAHGSESHPLMMKHAKGELKARPSHPPLAGRLLIGSLRSISPAAHPVVSR